MQQIVYRSEHPPFTWLDVTAPSEEELHELGAKYHLHAAAVQDSLDPEHLPKYERFADTSFLILRVYDPAASESAGTVQELTRKIAIFSNPDLTLTVHRTDLAVVADVRGRFGGPHPESECSPLTLLAALVNGALDSYDQPLQRAEEQIDALEEALFRRDIADPSLEHIHGLKRRVGLIKRMLWQTQTVIARLTPSGERPLPLYQDLKENAESYHFWADQLHDDLTNLLGINLTMASQRTNEVMRVLTVFSAFFLPLTFVVGVYGMNFRFMPELNQRWGYPMVLGVMAVISLVIFIWFRRRGWLGRRRP